MYDPCPPHPNPRPVLKFLVTPVPMYDLVWGVLVFLFLLQCNYKPAGNINGQFPYSKKCESLVMRLDITVLVQYSCRT